MTFAGLDVGSRTTVLVAWRGRLVDEIVIPTGPNPRQRCQELLAGKQFKRIVATGYGRHLVKPALAGEAISKIRAYAVGARHLHPVCRTVIDIGGQDTKVISLDEAGRVQRFEMNDRCAAGTGRFLEVMALALETEIGLLGPLALGSAEAAQVSSMCTVFAESEVVSLIGRGVEPAAIARGLHEAIAARVVAMVRRVGLREPVVFAGGAARNVCLVEMLVKRFGQSVVVPANPQTVGALGAALIAAGE
jgi:predicted CoA-substrate-specific enzyme activase